MGKIRILFCILGYIFWEDIKDVKNALNDITEYIKDSEADKAKIESRLDYLEKCCK